MNIEKLDGCKNPKCGVIILGDVIDYRICLGCLSANLYGIVRSYGSIEMEENENLTIVSDEYEEMEIKHGDNKWVVRGE